MKKTIILIVAILIVAVGATIIILNNQDNDNSLDSNAANSQGELNDEQGKDISTGEITGEKKGYFFKYKDVEIGINDEVAPILEALGEPMHYFEAPSCAFEGMDRIYSYSGFEFTTYTKDERDYISSIVFLDDTVETREGIALNSSLEDIITAYGNEYEKSFEQYSFNDGNCVISFILENNEVAAIEYAMDSQNNQEV